MITISQNRASIERFDSLVSVNENTMVFTLSHKKLSILGQHLRVVMFTSEEVWIEGEIKQVILDEK